MIFYISLALAGALVAVSTWTDLKSRAIFNRFTYPAAAAGLVLCIMAKQHNHLKGALIVFAVYLFFFLTGKMGGGDLKLAVALSLFLGMEAVIFGSIMAGIVIMAWGFAGTWHKTGQLRMAVLVMTGRLPGGEVPYGAILGPMSLTAAVMLLM